MAVRSSGLNEDGAQKSYAGVFESILNVTWDNLLSAIEEVHSSLRSARVAAYSGKEDERGGILVQKMVPAEYAGVLFTEHPASTGCMLAEVVPGLGDALVSGNATPKSYRFGRLTSTPLDSEKPPIDLAPLLTLGRKVEEIFGRPQDIEWAYSHGHFHILQARDITTSARDGSGPKALLERERDRLLSLAALGLAREAEARGQKGPETRATALFAQNELSELMPRPTPLSLSFMERLWSGGGSTDLACRALGVPYDVDEDAPPYANSVFGALYINRMEERRRLSRGPGALASFRLARAPAALEREFREEFLPRFLEEVRFREALEPSRLLLPELLSLFKEWTQRFVTETYVYAEKINLAADFYLKVAKKELEKRGLDPAAFLGHLPPTVVHQAMSLLPKIRSGEREVGEFLAIFGHRAPEDYELAQPRYREDPRLVAELASLAEVQVPDSRDGLLPPEGSDDKLLKVTMERSRHFQVLKEEAKHHALRELATLRTLLVEIDARLELDDGIFYLTVDEVAMLGDQFCNQAIDLIDRRRSIAEEWKAVELPTELTIVQLEGMNTEAITTGCAVVVSAGEKSGILRGTRVSGDKEVVGRVRVIHHPKEIHSFQAGEVLVARFTDPTWTPLFPMASGVITEVGGWLSHAAIVAREYNISGIVGVNGAMNSLKTGQMVRLCSNGTIEPIESDRRRHHRVPLLARVALSKQGETIDAILRNLSRTGALIEVGEELETGQGIHLRISSDTEEVRAEVVRKDASGRYGVHFTTPFGGPFPPYDPQEGPVKN